LISGWPRIPARPTSFTVEDATVNVGRAVFLMQIVVEVTHDSGMKPPADPR
jgi:hypothetical protein